MSEEGKYESVVDFYSGKSVFITGATGFLGKVIIEKLLYSCPKIQKVYILLRDKNGDDISQRMQKLLDTPIFTRIKNERPDDLDKIIPIPGDFLASKLGLRIVNEDELINKVSVVFHCAATVRFNETLKAALDMNVEGTRKILNLCRRMKKLKVFVHMSTTYCNCDRKIVHEVIYPPPMELNKAYEFVENHGDDDTQTSSILGDLPNTYAFTKALTENLIVEQNVDFKIIIIRPSIVTPSLHEPLEGWIDSWNGATGILTATAKGLIRVTLGKANNILDIVPVDYVSNLTIISAARAHSYEGKTTLNLSSSSVNPITMKEITTLFCNESIKNGFNDLPFPGVILTENKLIISFITAFLMSISYIADFLLRIVGRKPRFVKLQEQVNKIRTVLTYFISRSWIFKCENSLTLYNSLDENDRRLFPCDPKNINWKLYISIYLKGVNQYLMKNKKQHL